MTWLEMVFTGCAAYGLLFGVAWKAGWIDALLDRMGRRRKPMPPLKRDIPALRKDGQPLTHEEWERLACIFHGLPKDLQNAWERS